MRTCCCLQCASMSSNSRVFLNEQPATQVLLCVQRSRTAKDGRETNLGSEPLHEESELLLHQKETILPQRPEVANRIEGRISVLKLRHGLNRCRYR